MLLSLEQLEATAAKAEASKEAVDSARVLAPVLETLRCQALLSTAFSQSTLGSNGVSSSSSWDYSRLTCAFERILNKAFCLCAAETGELVRLAAAEVLPDLPRRPFASSDLDNPSPLGEQEPAQDMSVAASSSLEPVPMEEAAADDEECTLPCVTWVSVLLAALLPLISDALPKDQNGVCIIPHPHEMERQEAPDDTIHLHIGTAGRRPVYNTKKICDNCGTRIIDRYYFHCSENCDIDFCQECHKVSQELLEAHLVKAADGSRENMHRRLFWVIDITERVGWHVLHLNAADRERLARELAFEWPVQMFERLVQAAVDVVNARVVHVQDVKDIRSDERFWYAVGWLQFLYRANSLPCQIKKVEEQGSRGPKVPHERFILDGINKCEPSSEFQRWRNHPGAKVPDVLRVRRFELSADFCSFLTHTNLVPVSFRRVCLLCDVWQEMHTLQNGRIVPLLLEVPREPHGLMGAVIDCFSSCTGETQLRQPLRVCFQGEEAGGPGVTREFFQVALRTFLDGSGGNNLKLFSYQEQSRSYWFDESADHPEAFRAYGILLGQAVLNNTHVPNIFPPALYELLLEDLESPCARMLDIEDLGAVSTDIARSLQQVFDYVGEDINDHFGELAWPRGTRLSEESVLSQSSKANFVQAYIEWFFHERISNQLKPLSSGFRAILGGSALLRTMVDAVQLEKIVCGGAQTVDVEAIRLGAVLEGWTEDEESEYLPWFWEVLSSFTPAEKTQFVVFVTATDRVPLRGWQALGIIVQKNGVGDDRLPSAYTCFSQMLLPRFTTKEKLSSSLRLAIANSEGFGLR